MTLVQLNACETGVLRFFRIIISIKVARGDVSANDSDLGMFTANVYLFRHETEPCYRNAGS